MAWSRAFPPGKKSPPSSTNSSSSNSTRGKQLHTSFTNRRRLLTQPAPFLSSGAFAPRSERRLPNAKVAAASRRSAGGVRAPGSARALVRGHNILYTSWTRHRLHIVFYGLWKWKHLRGFWKALSFRFSAIVSE